MGPKARLQIGVVQDGVLMAFWWRSNWPEQHQGRKGRTGFREGMKNEREDAAFCSAITKTPIAGRVAH